MSNLTMPSRTLSPLSKLQQEFDHIVEQILRHPGLPAISSDTVFVMEPAVESWISTESKEFHLAVPLPGIKPEETDVQVHENRVILTAEREEKGEEPGKTFLTENSSGNAYHVRLI